MSALVDENCDIATLRDRAAYLISTLGSEPDTDSIAKYNGIVL